MLEMEEEESDSDDEIQKNLAKKREGGSSVGVELWGGDTPRHPVVSRLASTDRLLGPASPASSVNIFLIHKKYFFNNNIYDLFRRVQMVMGAVSVKGATTDEVCQMFY